MSVKISRAECDDEKRRGAAALSELLDLNGALGDPPVREQIEG